MLVQCKINGILKYVISLHSHSMLRKKATTISSPSVVEHISYFTLQKMYENVKEISNRNS